MLPTLPRREAGFGELTLEVADGRPHDVGLGPSAVPDGPAGEAGDRPVVDALDELGERHRLVGRRKVYWNGDRLFGSHGGPPLQGCCGQGRLGVTSTLAARLVWSDALPSTVA